MCVTQSTMGIIREEQILHEFDDTTSTISSITVSCWCHASDATSHGVRCVWCVGRAVYE